MSSALTIFVNGMPVSFVDSSATNAGATQPLAPTTTTTVVARAALDKSKPDKKDDKKLIFSGPSDLILHEDWGHTVLGFLSCRELGSLAGVSRQADALVNEFFSQGTAGTRGLDENLSFKKKIRHDIRLIRATDPTFALDQKKGKLNRSIGKSNNNSAKSEGLRKERFQGNLGKFFTEASLEMIHFFFGSFSGDGDSLSTFIPNRIKQFNFSKCNWDLTKNRFEDKEIAEVINRNGDLRVLHISHLSKKLFLVIEKLTRLKVLAAKTFDAHMVKYLPLEVLMVDKRTGLNKVELEILSTGGIANSLTSLDLLDSPLKDSDMPEIMDTLAKFSKLEKLTLPSSLTFTGISHVAQDLEKLTQLKELHQVELYKLRDENLFQSFFNHPKIKLTKLSLVVSPKSVEFFTFIQNASATQTLTDLNITFCSDMPLDFSIRDSANNKSFCRVFDILMSCTTMSLRTLQIKHTAVGSTNEDVIKELINLLSHRVCSELRQLYLSRILALTNSALETVISNCGKTLETLTLGVTTGGNKVNIEALKTFIKEDRNSPKLKLAVTYENEDRWTKRIKDHIPPGVFDNQTNEDDRKSSDRGDRKSSDEEGSEFNDNGDMTDSEKEKFLASINNWSQICDNSISSISKTAGSGSS